MLKPTFTIFTPTYNRRELLRRVYASLCRQSCLDFEWLVVDDGSTDDSESLVNSWCGEAPFRIRYVRQHNQGKHVAINVGVAAAEGAYFIPLDSDDECTTDAVERFGAFWSSISPEMRMRMASVCCLAALPGGRIVGTRFPEDGMVSTNLEIYGWRGVRGDKWSCYRTDVLRDFPFPVVDGERFISESIVWNRIALSYLTKYFNVALLIVHTNSPGSLSARSIQLRAGNPIGACLLYGEYIEMRLPGREKLKAVINYVRFRLHGGRRSLSWKWSILVVVIFPVALGMWFRDRIQLRSLLRN